MSTLGAALSAAARPVETPKEGVYGSGYFGRWIEDDFGLPAFLYTCDQTKDPKAVTSVTPGLLSATDHIHQLGNDRLVGIASNYGYVSVRQDEGAPKFLNEYNPQRGHYGGGIGWLTDGNETMSTYYSGGETDFRRIFGTGYFRKKVSGRTYSADQIIAAPFGDDPVLLSLVTIRNRGAKRAKLRWIEYWGCQVYQFSFRAFMTSFGSGISAVETRRRLGDRFAHKFEALPGNGLLEKKQFAGRLPGDEDLWRRTNQTLKTHPNAFLTSAHESVPEADFDDLNPPPTFLVSLDAAATAFSTNALRFFGSGGAGDPLGLHAGLENDLNCTGTESGLLLERGFTLNAGEERTLCFLYGYLPEGFELNALVTKYAANPAGVLPQSSKQWRARAPIFETSAGHWIRREVTWNYYYLRSSLTYDSFFHEHILSQGGIYQYVMGFQGAARDPLQHVLPFIFSDPEIVKDVLRYTLKEVRPDGSIPYGIVGHGAVMPATSDNASDLPLWLLWTASEYILATRDRAFLDEQIPTWPLYGPAAGRESVRNLLARCFRHLTMDVRTGEHGLMRMLNDDWNDALVTFWAQRATRECVERGESVLNSAMAAWVFDYYAGMLSWAGGEENAVSEARVKAEQNRRAAASQWTGQWLRRAWLGPTRGWLGEKGLWLEPQPWAILGGVTKPEQTRQLTAAMEDLLRRPSPIGALQMNPNPDMLAASMVEPGTSVNGGIWPSLNATLIWALALVDGKLAWDEWLKNSAARHAETYPDVWYGVLSGSDTWNAAGTRHPGETVNAGFLHYTDWPVMNLHSHACMLYALTKVLGIEFTPVGLRIAPVPPLESWRFETPLVGLAKTATGYEGWYAPLVAGEWEIEFVPPGGGAPRVIKGRSAPGKPLKWSVRTAH